MNKIKFMVLFCSVIASLSLYGQEALSRGDFVLNGKKIKIEIGQSVDEVIKNIGYGEERYQFNDTEHKDEWSIMTMRWHNLECIYYKSDRIVYNIIVKDNSYKTKRGASVGMKHDKIKNVYGKPFAERTDVIAYLYSTNDLSYYLYFFMQNGLVTRIEMIYEP